MSEHAATPHYFNSLQYAQINDFVWLSKCVINSFAVLFISGYNSLWRKTVTNLKNGVWGTLLRKSYFDLIMSFTSC